MALNVYARMAADRIESDWRNNTDFLSLLENSQLSREYTSMFKEANPGGSHAWTMSVPQMTISGVCELHGGAYDTASAYSDTVMDPTGVTYSEQTDTEQTPTVDNFVMCKTFINKLEAQAHAVGNRLLNEAVRGAHQYIRDQMTVQILATIEAAGQYESAGSPFGLTISTEATFKTDWDEIQAAMRGQDGSNYANWAMVLPAEWEGTMAMMDIFANKDYVYNSGNETGQGVVSGRVHKFAGMDLIFSPHFADANNGFIFSWDRVALITPQPVGVQAFTYHAEPLRDYYAFHKVWGTHLTGKLINNYDGNASATAREGIIELALS